jgi:hypothetical protein
MEDEKMGVFSINIGRVLETGKLLVMILQIAVCDRRIAVCDKKIFGLWVIV